MTDRGKKKRFIRLILFLSSIFILLTISKSLIPPAKRSVLSPIPEPTQQEKKPSKSFSFFQKKKNPDELADKVNNAINGAISDYSVYVEDYTSDFVMGLSESEIFTAASVNKVPILAALYEKTKDGSVDLDKTITLQQNEIQDYGTGSMRYDPVGTVYSIKTLARRMIKQSDNTAAYILGNEIIGLDFVQELVTKLGMTQTDMINNKTSNKDMAILFRNIYENAIASKALTQEMLSFLKDTDFETRLPGSLPPSVTVYHKIGSEVGKVHDVGIVTDGTTTYYLGVFTNDITDDAAAEKLIATVSKIVYDYLKQ